SILRAGRECATFMMASLPWRRLDLVTPPSWPGSHFSLTPLFQHPQLQANSAPGCRLHSSETTASSTSNSLVETTFISLNLIPHYSRGVQSPWCASTAVIGAAAWGKLGLVKWASSLLIMFFGRQDQQGKDARR